jgi:hypothetical protein
MIFLSLFLYRFFSFAKKGAVLFLLKFQKLEMALDVGLVSEFIIKREARSWALVAHALILATWEGAIGRIVV